MLSSGPDAQPSAGRSPEDRHPRPQLAAAHCTINEPVRYLIKQSVYALDTNWIFSFGGAWWNLWSAEPISG